MQNCRENNSISCLYTKHAYLFDLIIIHFFWGDMWTTFIIATHLRQLLRQLPTSYQEAKPPVTASVWNPLIWCTDNIHTAKHPFLHTGVWSTYIKNTFERYAFLKDIHLKISMIYLQRICFDTFKSNALPRISSWKISLYPNSINA